MRRASAISARAPLARCCGAARIVDHLLVAGLRVPPAAAAAAMSCGGPEHGCNTYTHLGADADVVAAAVAGAASDDDGVGGQPGCGALRIGCGPFPADWRLAPGGWRASLGGAAARTADAARTQASKLAASGRELWARRLELHRQRQRERAQQRRRDVEAARRELEELMASYAGHPTAAGAERNNLHRPACGRVGLVQRRSLSTIRARSGNNSLWQRAILLLLLTHDCSSGIAGGIGRHEQGAKGRLERAAGQRPRGVAHPARGTHRDLAVTRQRRLPRRLRGGGLARARQRQWQQGLRAPRRLQRSVRGRRSSEG